MRNDTSSEGTMYLSKYLKCVKEGYLEIEHKFGLKHKHALHFEWIPINKTNLNDEQPKGMIPYIDG